MTNARPLLDADRRFRPSVRVLDALARPKTAQEVMEATGINRQTTYQHIRLLESLGLVRQVGETTGGPHAALFVRTVEELRLELGESLPEDSRPEVAR